MLVCVQPRDDATDNVRRGCLSQAAVAGYKAALLAADTFGGFFPMLTTARTQPM